MGDNNVISAIVIGGGLVGPLCACFLAKRGYHVTVYESRDDFRNNKINEGRSINLALSARGRKALKSIGLEEEVLKNTVPMKGRLIHCSSGGTKSILYDKKNNQCIYSVGRDYLNKLLLSATEKYPKVELKFNHKLISCNFDAGEVTFLKTKTNERTTAKADIIIGADGAFSRVRRCMQQTQLFEYSQKYIEHGYLELRIPTKENHKMIQNHLHIWPRGTFMMIALPNKDNSWTVTLFMPFEKFNKLTTGASVLEFFEKEFGDAVDLIGRDHLVEVFSTRKPSPLISVKCSPYDVASKFLIIGDASHAIVPFYGQGMNAGFEDCSLLGNLLSKNKDNIGQTLSDFTRLRKIDAFAISDLAMYNYIEMRDLVNRKSYYIRKVIDDCLYKLLGNTWLPLYNSVTFSEMDFSDCMENKKWQDKVLKNIAVFSFLVPVSATILAFYFR